eukprot:427404_1
MLPTRNLIEEFPVTNSYDEFKLKMKLWKLIDNHSNNQFGAFMTQLCMILSKHSTLQQFKYAFVNTLFQTSINTKNIVQEINAIEMLSIEPRDDSQNATQLSSMNNDIFIYMTSFLRLEDIIEMQRVDREMLTKCRNPLIYRDQDLYWTCDRYRFGQNLSHWRFDLVKNIHFINEEDTYEHTDLKCKLHINQIKSNWNTHWKTSVIKLCFDMSSTSNAEYTLLSLLPRFQNLKQLTIESICGFYDEQIFARVVTYNQLQYFKYYGSFNESMLANFSKCSALETLKLEGNLWSEYKNDVGGETIEIGEVDVDSIISKWTCKNMKNISIEKYEMIRFDEDCLSHKIAFQAINTSNCKINLSCQNQVDINDLQIVFAVPNVALKLNSIQVDGWNFVMIELMKLLSRSMLQCFKKNEKLELVNISCYYHTEWNEQMITETINSLETLVKYSRRIELKTGKMNIERG